MPQPPVAPSLQYQHILVVTITVAGDVSSFDAATFKAHLATLARVRAAQITLEIAPASMAVTAHISTESSVAATAASAALSKSPSALSQSLGVDVEAVSMVAVERQLAAATLASLSPTPIVLDVVLSTTLMVVLIVGLGCLRSYRLRRRERLLLNVSVESDAVMQRPEQKEQRHLQPDRDAAGGDELPADVVSRGENIAASAKV